LPLLGGFACKVCLQRLSKISLEEARFLLPLSSCHLGISPRISYLRCFGDAYANGVNGKCLEHNLAYTMCVGVI
jgi:hypothetical protein